MSAVARRRVVSIRAAVIQQLENRRLLAAVDWDGSGDGVNWTDPSNWSNNAVPGTADDVTVNVAANPTIIITSSQSVRSLINAENLRIVGNNTVGGAHLSVVTTGSNSALIELTSAGDSREARLGQSGGTITNNAGGIVRMLPGTGGPRELGGNIINNGTIEYTANSTGGSNTLQSLTNNGAITIAAGVTGSVLFTTSGGGTSTFTQNGTITSDSTSRLRFSSATFKQTGGSVTGTGMRLEGGSIDIDAASAASIVVLENTNTLIGNDVSNFTVRVEGNNLVGGAALNGAPGGATNAGIIELTSAGDSRDVTFGSSEGGTLTNTATGMIRALPGSGGGRNLGNNFINNGLIEYSAGVPGTSSTLRSFTNNGTFTVGSGAVVNLNLTTSGGGSTIVTQNGAVSGAGRLVFGSSIFRQTGGTITGTPLRVENSTIEITGGTAGSTVVAENTNTLVGHISANVTLRVEGNNLVGGATLNGAAGGATNAGIIELTSAGDSRDVTFGSSAGGTLTNAATGIIRALAGTGGGRNLGNNIVNNGLIEYATNVPGSSSTLWSFTNNGTFTVGSGAVVNLNLTTSGGGTTIVTQNGTVSGAGRLIFSSSIFKQTGGGITGTPLRVQNSTIEITGGSAGSTVVAESTNTLLVHTASSVTLQVEGNNLVGTATINFQGNFANTGIIALTSAGDARDARLTVPEGFTLTNNGTITVLEGTGGGRSVTLGNSGNSGTAMVNNGTINVGANALFTVNGVRDTEDTFTQAGNILIGSNGAMAVETVRFNYIAGSNQPGLRLTNTRIDLDAATSASTVLAVTGNTLLGHDAANLSLVVLGSQFGTGTLTVPADVTSTGPITLDSTNGSTARILVAEGFTYTNAGVITFAAGGGGARSIELGNSGNAGTTFINNGTLSVAAGVNAALNGVRVDEDVFRQNGTITVGSNGLLEATTLQLNYVGGSNTSGFRVANSRINLDAAAISSNVLAIVGNTLVGHDAANLTLLVQGTQFGTATLTIPGDLTSTGPITLDSSNGSSARITVGEGFTYTNAGVITFAAGAGGGRSIELGNSGSASTTFINNGTLSVAAGVTTTINGVRVDEDVFRQNGTITVAAGALLEATTLQLNYVGGSNNAGFRVANSRINLTAASAPSTLLAIVGNTLVNHTAVNITLVNRGSEFGTATLTIPADLTTTGTINLDSSNGSTSRITVGEGFVYTNSGTINVIAGAGGGRSFELGNSGSDSTTFINNGTLSVAAGVTTNINGVRVDEDVFRQNGTLTVGAGASLEATTLQLNYVGGSNTAGFRVSNSRINLTAASAPSTVLAIVNNTLVGHSAANITLVVQGTQFGTATLNVPSTAANSGLIVLDSVNGSASQISVPNDGVFTNNAGGVVRIEPGAGGPRNFNITTTGQNPGQFINNGTIRIVADADIGGSGPVTNNALLLKPDTGESTFAPSLVNNNTGVVDISAGTLRFNGTTNLNDAAGAFLSGGTYRVASGATLGFGTSPSQRPTINTADVEVSGTGVVEFDRLQTNRGRIALLDSADTTIAPTNSPATFTNEGIIDLSPGSILTVTGRLNFGGASQPVVRAEIASAASFGRIVVSGVIDLNSPDSTSRFDPDLVNGFDPALGSTFAIMTGSSIVNGFDSFQGGLTPSGNVLAVFRPNAQTYGAQIIPGPPPPAPQILSQTYEDETRQAVTFQFDQDVSAFLSRKDFILQNLTTGQTIANTAGTLSYNQPSNQATLLLTNQLPDGNYRLTVNAADIANSAGVPASGAPITLQFYIFAGDADRNRTINIGDFSVLASRFNQPGTYSQGDFNYSGTTEIGDFAILASKFNTSLPAPRVTSPAQMNANVFSKIRVEKLLDSIL